MPRKSILFISNGFAEDTLGANLAKELKDFNLSALPIVGLGNPYRHQNIPIIAPCWELPSQGITFGEEFDLFQEVKAGAIQLYLAKAWALWRQRKKFDLVICVGDYLSTMAAGVFAKKSLVYLWVTASHFDPIAKHFLKKYAVMIFSRWRKWEHLPEFKVEFFGNPYMDAVTLAGDDFGLDKDKPCITVLPGAREPAIHNLPKIVKVLELVNNQKPVNVVFALSLKTANEEFLKAAAGRVGWHVTYDFGDALNNATLVLGLSGTGNEQASGLGKPLVSFWGGGHSREEGFVKWHQEVFLKGAQILLSPDDPQAIANMILSLLNDPDKMREMGEKGIELNGGTGATQVIAERIKEWLANH